MEMFPTKTQNQIQLALTEHGNMDDAVLALTTSIPEENDIIATTNLELKKDDDFAWVVKLSVKHIFRWERKAQSGGWRHTEW